MTEKQTVTERETDRQTVTERETDRQTETERGRNDLGKNNFNRLIANMLC